MSSKEDYSNHILVQSVKRKSLVWLIVVVPLLLCTIDAEAQSFQVQAAEQQLGQPTRTLSFLSGTTEPYLSVTNDGKVLNLQTNKVVAEYYLSKFQSIKISGSKYIVRSTNIQEKSSGDSGDIRWRIFDDTGNLLQEIEHPLGYDQPAPTLWPSPDGSRFLLTNPWNNELIWYSSTEKISTTRLPVDNIDEPYEVVAQADWSEDSRRVIVGLEIPSRDTEIPVMLFDADGNELWNKTYPAETMDGVIAPGDGDYFIVVGHTWKNRTIDKMYFLLNARGEILQRGSGIATGARINASGRMIVWGRRFLQYYGDVVTAPVWTKDFSDDKRSLSLGARFTTGNAVGLIRGTSTSQNGEYVFTQPRLLIYQANGTKSWEDTFSDEILYSPAIEFSDDASEFVVPTDTKIHRVRVTQ